ncbi:MAG: EAL domain-containing protein [Velocimicrobium sp.]
MKSMKPIDCIRKKKNSMKAFYESHRLSIRNLKTIFLISLISSVVVAGILLLLFRLKYNSEKKAYLLEQKSMIEVTELFFNEKILAEYSDLLLLRESKEITDYLNYSMDTNRMIAVQKLFLSYAEKKIGITQIRMLDANGMEQVRVNKTKNDVILVDKAQLQNKMDRYYFKDSMNLDEKQMYISNFDLNIEQNDIVKPYEPTIRFAVKLYSSQGEEKGVLIINVDGYKFLEVIGKYELVDMDDKEIGVLDSNNYWSINHTDENNLASVTVIKGKNTQDQVSQLINEIIKKQSSSHGQFDFASKHYAYKKIGVSTDKSFVFEVPDFNWYIIGYFDMKQLLRNHHLVLEHVVPITVVACILVSFFMNIIINLYLTKEKNHIRLMATSYIPDNSHDGIIIVDENMDIVYCNHVFEETFGWTKSELLKQSIKTVIKLDVSNEQIEQRSPLVWKGNEWEMMHSGTLICKHVTVNAVKNHRNKLQYFIYIFSNPYVEFLGKNSLQVEELNSLMMDSYEIDLVGDSIARGNTEEDSYIIVSMQMIGSGRKLFEANQMLHGTFVKKLEEEIKKLRGLKILAIPRTDMIIFLKKIEERAFNQEDKTGYDVAVSEVVEEIKKMVKSVQIFQKSDELEMEFALGIACYGEHGKEGRLVLKNSLIALEALMKFKKSNYLVYDEKFNDYICEDRKIRSYLKTAFEKKEFYVVYQPQFRTLDDTMIGMEALVRWNNEKMGLVSPDRFIPVLEEMEQIQKMGITVMEIVKKDLNDIQGMIHMPIRVSINLSSQEFANVQILKELKEKIKEIDTRKFNFCIEITETTLIENIEVANNIIEAYHTEGFEIAIDDFGTGYSSLGYLKKLVADELKIDRMFIKDYPDMDDGKLIHAISSLGREMKMRLVVEGVETKEQQEFVKELGIEIYQGYYGSRPLEINQLKKKLIS